MPVPQIVGLVVAGASVYAGIRLIVSNIQRMLEEAERERTNGEPRTSMPPRDEGALEWDEAAGVYRPQRRA